MIIVKNRELLIPNNERYIGTTYDNETENRVFQVPRFSQRGVDLANLTFRLDIQYANESYDTVVLDKEVGEAFIILIWRITSATLQVPGTLYIGLRAIDDEATVKWSSFSAAMYAERHLNTPGNYGGSLTEIEQMEQDHQYMKGVVDELKSHLDYTHEAEAWAIGKKDGEDVPSTDETYHNNSKYYSDQASTKATQAANSATAAANSATQAAETVSDTNTRFNNAVAAVTSETEVIDARVGADGTTYPVLKNRLDAEHNQLKNALHDTNEVLSDAVFTLVDTTLTATYSGYVLNPAGYVRENSGYNVSQFINVENANGIIPDYDLRFTVDASDYVGVAFFAANAYGNPLKVYPYVDNGFIYPVPDGAKYAALTYTSGTASKVIVLTKTTDGLDTRVDALESEMSEIVTKVPDDRQLYDNSDPHIFNGYCNGVNFYGSNAHRILYIPCKPNTYYTISADASLWVTNGVFTSPSVPVNGGSANSFSARSDAVTVVENGRRYITNKTESNANYLSVIYYNSNVSQTGTADEVRATVMIAEGTNRTEFVPYTIEIKLKESALPDSIIGAVVYDRAISREAASLSTGGKLEFNSPNIKKNNLVTFSANIGTFGTLTIGQGRDALNQTAYIVIDATTVKVYRYTTEPVEWVSLNHGLTIADYIDVSIIVSNDEIGWAKLIITSNGATYTYARMAWLGCGNVVYAEATSGSYANCVLKHSCTDYDKEVWMLGDSYFDHWVTHALADGYKNFLCDGWSGRRSAQALNSLDILLNHGKPKFIVWCMGMNDGDSTTAVNSNWKTAYDELIAICEADNIIPVLCTIPNTPTVNNNFKNAIIRSSGYEYIDMAKAVGSDISTSWYTGLLSSDNVHPSTLGDAIIAKFMETALPQIFGN